MQRISRRGFIAGLAGTGIIGPAGAAFAQTAAGSGRKAAGFLNILRPPDSVTGFLSLTEPIPMQRSGNDWSGGGLRVRATPEQDRLPIQLAAHGVAPAHIHLRWQTAVSGEPLILGDAWERSYGDLHWASIVPERVMPWYFLATDGDSLHGYGVQTGAAALCFWQLDPMGVSLWLDVRNGGSGVNLGDRELLAATVVTRQGQPGEDPLSAARAFCRTMCPAPRPPLMVYGSNDWYYAYGHNTAEQIVRDAELMASLAPGAGPRPFTVVDDGWKNKQAFPDMAALASAIRSHHVRPGLWIRPLQAMPGTPAHLLLPDARFGRHTDRSAELAYDPTVPEAMEAVLAKVTQATGWGFELVKHDYSTYDLLGQWGFEMGAEPTLPGWSLQDRTRTNAEIIRDLYASIRRAAGVRTLLIGCNTVGHLGAGIFDAQRTGDDVSGRLWERTRRMGVNTLAFRLPQHGAFFALDADCVPITTETPWSCNRQWLDVLARSGTTLLVSPEPAAMGKDQRDALREAFAIAASAASAAVSTDWQRNTTPDEWKFNDSSARRTTGKNYDWYQNTGAWPFGL